MSRGSSRVFSAARSPCVAGPAAGRRISDSRSFSRLSKALEILTIPEDRRRSNQRSQPCYSCLTTPHSKLNVQNGFDAFPGSVAAAGEELQARMPFSSSNISRSARCGSFRRARQADAGTGDRPGPAGGPAPPPPGRGSPISVATAGAWTAAGKIWRGRRPKAIAGLEADRDAAMTARTLFASEITRLKRQAAVAEARITELYQGLPHRARLGSGSCHAPRHRGHGPRRIHAAGGGEHAERASARVDLESPGRRRCADRKSMSPAGRWRPRKYSPNRVLGLA